MSPKRNYVAPSPQTSVVRTKLEGIPPITGIVGQLRREEWQHFIRELQTHWPTIPLHLIDTSQNLTQDDPTRGLESRWDWLVICESWRGEFSQDQVSCWLSRQPLLRIIWVQGLWCASAQRSHPITPPGFVTPRWLASSRLFSEWMSWHTQRQSLPLSASREEWLATLSDDWINPPHDLYDSRAARARDVGPSVLIDVTDPALHQMLSEEIELMGGKIVTELEPYDGRIIEAPPNMPNNEHAFKKLLKYPPSARCLVLSSWDSTLESRTWPESDHLIWVDPLDWFQLQRVLRDWVRQKNR